MKSPRDILCDALTVAVNPATGAFVAGAGAFGKPSLHVGRKQVIEQLLGFLGLGPQDPSTPEWGTMLTDSTRFLRQAPFLLLFPGGAIVITAIGFNLLGDGLRESLDPRLKR
mgnify:CR=1 FL=1